MENARPLRVMYGRLKVLHCCKIPKVDIRVDTIRQMSIGQQPKNHCVHSSFPECVLATREITCRLWLSYAVLSDHAKLKLLALAVVSRPRDNRSHNTSLNSRLLEYSYTNRDQRINFEIHTRVLSPCRTSTMRFPK